MVAAASSYAPGMTRFEPAPAKDEILAVRKLLGWTQLDAAIALGIVESTFRNYEKGRQDMPAAIWKAMIAERDRQRAADLGFDSVEAALDALADLL